ncbi:hypothetical protein C8R46DRAFT_890208 [Mycena filopes]|nr:hypothetical protein C8R46DRAFT_890208 [Mycena filopes]
MANINRRTKSGGEWTRNELKAYNIHLSFEDAATFFGVAQLPAPMIDNEILTAADANNTTNDANYVLLSLLDLAMSPISPQQSAVTDFVVALLRALGYDHRPRVARTHQELHFVICGESACATPDVSVVDLKRDDIILLVEQHQGFSGATEAYARLIADAIAAYQTNQTARIAASLPRLPSSVIPGIVMTGTFPTFCKIPVTEELVGCVERGDYPSSPTTVSVHIPSVPRPNRRLYEGMVPLDHRRIILECFEAFKAFVL